MVLKTPLLLWRAAVAAMALVPWVVCAQVPSASTLRHGIVHLDGQGHLTLVTARPLPTQGDVHFQYPDDSGEPVCCKRLPLSSFKPVTLPAGTATDMVSGEPPLALRTAVPRQDTDMPFVGAAVLGDVASARMARGKGLAARARDGGTATSTTCISSEGFQVIDKAGKGSGPKGKARTHLYLNLGYDIEGSTCR